MSPSSINRLGFMIKPLPKKRKIVAAFEKCQGSRPLNPNRPSYKYGR